MAAVEVRESDNIFRAEVAPLDRKSCGVVPYHLGYESRAVRVHDPSRAPAQLKAHPDLRQGRDRQGGGDKSAADAEVGDKTATDQAVRSTKTDRERYLETFTPSMLHEMLPRGRGRWDGDYNRPVDKKS